LEEKNKEEKEKYEKIINELKEKINEMKEEEVKNNKNLFIRIDQLTGIFFFFFNITLFMFYIK
jgi:hypothetical protein